MTSTQVLTSYDLYDLDTDASCQALLAQVTSTDSNNFAVLFDREKATASANLDRDELNKWLEDSKDEAGVQWIHFWSSPDQRPLIEDVASRYEVSPRLLSLICPRKSATPVPQPAPPPQASTLNRLLSRPSWASRTKDVEKIAGPPNDRGAAPAKPIDVKDLSFTDVVNNIWHFHSIDWGHRYVHIGVNVLAVIPGLQHRATDRPAGQRLWTSILLCDDGTVISSFERPPHHASEEVNKASNEVIKRHVLNVLKHLSALKNIRSSSTSDLMSVMIRPERSASPATAKAMSESERMETASLLFYYLFDDWMTTYALIAQREHSYRQSLEDVRRALSRAPDAELLETLHSIGRQLTVLQLMYQSYGTVITRLLHRYQPTTITATNLRADNMIPQQGTGRSNAMPSISNIQQSPPSRGHQGYLNSSSTATPTVQFSFLAIGRFERLLDRVHLYALNEINHCLAEKESLVLMTFNLLALSESHSVEKLTRTTILLAKATILFLPVSLTTAYFSLSIGNIDTIYSLRTYWFTFLVVAIASILFLYLFGFATGTIEGKIVYQSLHKALWEKSIAALLRRRRQP